MACARAGSETASICSRGDGLLDVPALDLDGRELRRHAAQLGDGEVGDAGRDVERLAAGDGGEGHQVLLFFAVVFLAVVFLAVVFLAVAFVACGLGGRRGGGAVLGAERLVDVDQRALVPLADRDVGQDRGDDVAALVVVEDPGPHVERLGGDPQPLGDLGQDLGAGLLQPALDLAQVRVGHPGGLRELAQGHLRRLPLLADVLTQRADLQRCHAFTLPRVLTVASTQQACFPVRSVTRGVGHKPVSTLGFPSTAASGPTVGGAWGAVTLNALQRLARTPPLWGRGSVASAAAVRRRRTRCPPGRASRCG